jgi:hypothetical protein
MLRWGLWEGKIDKAGNKRRSNSVLVYSWISLKIPAHPMTKLQLTSVLASFFLALANCPAQDTIRVERSHHYTRKEDPNRGMLFAAKVRYAREDIVFSETHKRIEYCYYYDQQRICYGTNYWLSSDSTIDIDDIRWHFVRQGRRYFVSRYFDGTYESGYVRSLIPFETIGLFTTTTADRAITLWTTDYRTDRASNPYDKPRWIFHKTKIQGKLYEPANIDEAPTLLNGEALKPISLQRRDGCYNEPFYQVRELKFVVTETGRIINIEQSIGNIDLDFCPYYVMDLMRALIQYGPLKPAKLKGQNVAVLWTLAVDMR